MLPVELLKIIEYDIKSEEPMLIDITGYRGTGLYVLHKNGFSPVNRFEYYPVWQLHLNYITPKVINSFAVSSSTASIFVVIFHRCYDQFWSERTRYVTLQAHVHMRTVHTQTHTRAR